LGKSNRTTISNFAGDCFVHRDDQPMPGNTRAATAKRAEALPGKTRLLGTELDAALEDPRWQALLHQQPISAQ
jgi:hypothetical protein